MHKNVTPRVDYTYSHDVAGRTGTPFSVYSLPLTRHSLDAGLELILDRETLVTLSADAIFESGHQEKPYRWLPMSRPASCVPAAAPQAIGGRSNTRRGRVAENTPTTRQRFAFDATGSAPRRHDVHHLRACVQRQLRPAREHHGPSPRPGWSRPESISGPTFVPTSSSRRLFWQLGYTAQMRGRREHHRAAVSTGDREPAQSADPGAAGAGLLTGTSGSGSNPMPPRASLS